VKNGAPAKGSRLLLLKVMSVTTRAAAHVISGAPATWLGRDVNEAAKGIPRLLPLKVMSVTTTRKVGCDVISGGWKLGAPAAHAMTGGPCDMTGLPRDIWGWAGGWSEQSGLPRRELGLLMVTGTVWGPWGCNVISGVPGWVPGAVCALGLRMGDKVISGLRMSG
jgi:hypothetical protein